MTRARESLVNNNTQMKNRIHQAPESSCIKISSVLSDIFGKSGRYILDGLLEGKSINDILAGIKSKRIRNKEQELREAIKNSLDPAKILIIQNCLELMEEIQKKIKKLDMEIMSRIKRMKEDLEIAISIPGIAVTSASAILAEIGDYRDFENGEKFASWCGLTPKVSQSANKLVTGSITKQGSKHTRWMLIQVAHTISTKNSAWKRFFLKIQAKKGTKKASVALARKLLSILHHLLMTREFYHLFGKGEHNLYQFDDTELAQIDDRINDKNPDKAYLTFHSARMYSYATRLKVYQKSGTFPKVTKDIGLESLRSVLEEDAKFPTSKNELVEKQGWKVFDLTEKEHVHASTLLNRLPM